MIADLDHDIWAAIGDPTRLQVLDMLVAGGAASASSLGRQLPVSRQAIAKHLSVLERSGLVHPEPAGREVRYSVDARQFAKACAQVQQISLAWSGRLQRIKQIAETIERTRRSSRPTSPQTD